MKSKFNHKNDELESEEFNQDEATDPGIESDRTGFTNIASSEEKEEAEEELSLLDKIKAKLNPPKKSSKNKTSPKRKNSFLIQGIIVVAVVYLVMTEFFPDEPEAPAPVLKARPKKVEQEPLPEQQAPVVENPAPEMSTTATTPIETTESSTNLETPPESPVEVTSSEQPSLDTQPEPTLPAETTVTSESEPAIPSEPETPAPPVLATPSEDSVTGEATIPEDDNLTDKILEDIEKHAKDSAPADSKKEYVAPPDYEYKGRGLVYNCSGKHWACVDAPSYKACEDNSAGNKYLKKAAECYPFNVYESQKGCESIQSRMVSSGAKTNFCGEN